MKHKLAKALAAVVAVICAVSGMVACSGGGDVTVKLVDSSAERVVLRVEKTDGKANAFDMLEYLEDKGQLTVTSEDSAYGAFITAINGVANRVDESTATSSKGYSWTLYTSDLQNAYEETTITVEGRQCGMAAFGASTLIAKEGALYVWVYEYYSYEW